MCHLIAYLLSTSAIQTFGDTMALPCVLTDSARRSVFAFCAKVRLGVMNTLAAFFYGLATWYLFIGGSGFWLTGLEVSVSMSFGLYCWEKCDEWAWRLATEE